jgi:GntR family transcriptional regulator/MocR family aminotransferase
MVVPKPLAPRVKQAINITGQFAPLILQAALAASIEQGHFARHLRRMRRLYARRRYLFVQACSGMLSEFLTPAAGGAGIQTIWILADGYRDVAVAEAAERHALNVAPLSRHYHHGNAQNGLVLGYAALDAAAMRAELKKLRRLLIEMPKLRGPALGRAG